MAKKFIIPPNQHVFIAGATGSGKTFLAEQYLTSYENVACLDTKGLFNWPNVDCNKLVIIERISELNFIDPKMTPKLIYRPIWEEMNTEHYDKFFEWCYKRRNTVVYVDEFMSVSDNPFKIPNYAKAILTRGREHNVALWSSSQRPSGISQLALSEATHFFVFRLNLPADREKMARMTGQEKLLMQPQEATNIKNKHLFWYYHVEEDSPVLAVLK